MPRASPSPTRPVVPSLTIENELELEAPKRYRILVVDDSDLICGLFCDTLSDRYDCKTAHTYDGAIESLQKFDFELVITDVMMPGLSGIELLRKIVDKYPDTSVIVVSGQDRKSTR